MRPGDVRVRILILVIFATRQEEQLMDLTPRDRRIPHHGETEEQYAAV